jgi:hypothetical protein
VSSGIGAVRESPRGLDDDVDTQIRPRQCFGIALLQQGDRAVLDHQIRALVPAGCVERTLDGVEGEQVHESGGIAEVIDRNDLEVSIVGKDCPNEVASDSPEPVDPHTRHSAHVTLPTLELLLRRLASTSG